MQLDKRLNFEEHSSQVESMVNKTIGNSQTPKCPSVISTSYNL